jgi:MATE family multidrug resistance protein
MRFTTLRGELRPMLSLAAPLILAELGWMTMGIVDTLMVGRLSPEAIGAVGIGSSVFLAVGVFAMGLLLGLDTLVSQAHGAGRIEECHRWLVHGVALSLLLTLPVTAGLFLVISSLHLWGLDSGVLELTRPYFQVITWSVLPLLLYACFRRYLQGMGSARPAMIALVVANVANVFVNWVLIFGNLGMPALGVAGAGWATVGSRVVMAAVLLAAIVYRERRRRAGPADTVDRDSQAGHRGLFEIPFRVELAWTGRLLALGLPAALQLTLEIGVFAAATVLAGQLMPAALAAHQIALNLAGFTFMVPLGLASAGAVRVGHAVGRRDAFGAARAGWTALVLGAIFMLSAAAVFVLVPGVLIGAFTSSRAVLEIGVALLAVAAVFQLFDGLQGVATGILRGLGDTRTPMLWNLAGHWLVGLPIAYMLAFTLDFGVIGLWWGLSLGLIICGVALVAVWWKRIHAVLHLLSYQGGGPMAEQHERPRPHGDPLRDEMVEPNRAQRQSDAPGDVSSGDRRQGISGEHDRAEGQGSTANGIPASDEDDGKTRRRQYSEGAEIVSRID